MEFFKSYFHNVNFEENKGEVKVLCPFHNDTKPSATVNTEKNLFHCWVCGTGYNEEQFMAEVKHIPVSQAIKLLSELSVNTNTDWEVSFQAELWADHEVLEAVRKLGFSDDMIEKMRLGLSYVDSVKTLAFPVFYDGAIMDVRRYNVLKDDTIPKMTSNKKAKSGWIVPYDIWKTSTETTYVFEGEKDMFMARQLGLNAITLTGGASAVPNEFCLSAFTGRDVVICYDNDEAGKTGMQRVANAIYKVANSVLTLDISQVVKEKGEDFYDYIHKYEGDVFDFIALEVEPYVPVVVPKVYTKINDAMAHNLIKRELTSIVTITSEFVEAYNVPSVIQGTKVKVESDNDTMSSGEKRYWTLDDSNVHEILALVEVDAKLTNVQQKAFELLGISKREGGVKLEFRNTKLVYRCTVTDSDSDGVATPIDLYSFDRLKVGQQYEIKYKFYAHPAKHQRLVAIATETVSTNDSGDFVVEPRLLSQFKTEGSIQDRVNHIFQSTRHYVAKHMNFNIWFMSDLVFNSILDFKYGEVMRGALDVFILGDTEVGKSETNELLVKLYKFGHFLSLKTSSTVGLIGGSNKVEGSWSNTIGAIPRQHKKLVVLEEFSGAKQDFIKTMTDIRTSNELKLTRASGELHAPCKVRMITISNPINDESGAPRNLNSFPNGVIPIMELIKGAEDVRRYDGFLLAPKPEKLFNPFTNQLTSTPIPKEAYEHKAKWIYTRGVDDVLFDEGVESYIWDKAEYLNSLFECNVPIFGTTTSKKLARFCVALASLVMNTDSTFTKVIVTTEIVDYMVEFLIANYSSSYFKLDKVKEEWDSYNKVTQKDIEIAEELYPNNSTLFEFLSNQSRTTRANLQAISGHDRDKFGVVFNVLVRQRLIRLSMENVYPTEKFRKVFASMNKTVGKMVSRHDDSDHDL